MVVSPTTAIEMNQHEICGDIPVHMLVVPIRICQSFQADLRLLANLYMCVYDYACIHHMQIYTTLCFALREHSYHHILHRPPLLHPAHTHTYIA